MTGPWSQLLATAQQAAARGEWVQARHAADRLLEQQPDHSQALIVRVNASLQLGDGSAVIDGLQHLLRLHPLNSTFSRMLATAINNRGSAHRRAGASEAARGDFESAIELDPAHPQAWFNLGMVMRDLGRRERAAEALRRHLRLQPDDRDAQLLLATLQSADAAAGFLASIESDQVEGFDAGWLAHTAARAGQTDLCLQALRRLGSDSDMGAATEAITELRLRGAAEAAREGGACVAETARRSGRSNYRAELIAELALPALYRDRLHLQEERDRFRRGLQHLQESWSAARLRRERPALNQLAHSNFLLAYQGLDDRPLQAGFAELIERALQEWAPDLREPVADAVPGRVGLVSSCWRECTVGAYFGGWIDWIRRSGREVFLYQIGPQRDAATDRLAQSADRFIFLEARIEDIAQRLRADRLDLLIYPEIGMDARLTPLAGLRLARRQTCAWGHPVTSGFSTVDEFLSCARMEPADADSHYFEQLTLLDDLGVEYTRPPLPAPPSPADVGLDPGRPRILVPQSLFKLHPDVDQVMADIARELGAVQFVLFESEHASLRAAYERRLGSVFAQHGLDPARHLCFQPIGSRERFLRINQACDLMLDSLHWSGGNTAIDALQCGLPIVACSGRFMRGRQSRTMLEMLDLADALDCPSPQAQAARCVELIRRPHEREQLSHAILSGREKLFDPTAARASFQRWLARVAA